MSFFLNKAVIVTGSSTGIGRATAKMFAEKGAKLTIHGRNAANLEITKKECMQAGAKEDHILEVIGEIEKEQNRHKLIDETIKKFGQLDVLVNNAGLVKLSPDGKGDVDASLETYDLTMEVNLRAVLHLVKLAVPHLELTHGAIVNVSSVAALPFAITDFYYSISKAGLDQLTLQLGGSLILRGIRVNSVNPGVVDTDIRVKVGLTPEQAKKLYHEKIAKNRLALPLGRTGTGEDIAKIILFLADRTQSEYIVGQRIVADGGSALKNVLLSTDFMADD